MLVGIFSVYQICISGSAKGKTVEAGKRLAHEAGVAVAAGGHALLTGATTGLPYEAAVAYKQAGGSMSIGISPAASKIEHVMKYRLPVRPYDVIIYTGMHYVGRDTFLIGSSDAVISIGGRLGTLHEATTAMETHTPIGFLSGAGGTGDFIPELMKAAGQSKRDYVVFGDDVKQLLSDLIAILDIEHKEYKDVYS